MKALVAKGVTRKIVFEQSKRRSGFTLAEMLVVIVIIGILASLLLPVLSKAKSKAQSAVCLGNLKQLQLAWLAYAEDDQGQFPPNHLDYCFGRWRSARGSWVIGDAQTDIDPSNIQAGVLFPYSRAVKLYRCPSDESKSACPFQRDRTRTRSYAVNYFLGTKPGTYVDPAWMTSCNTRKPQYVPGDPWEPTLSNYAQMIRPAPVNVFCFLDVQEQSIDSGDFDLDRAAQTWEHLPSDRHGRGANVSFADGHVEHYRWRAPKKFLAVDQAVTSNQDREDFQRLAAGIPTQR